MAYTTFDDVTYLDARLLPRRDFGPALRGAVVIGLGIVGAAGVVAAMAAASMIFSPSSAPIAAKAPIAPSQAILARASQAPAVDAASATRKSPGLQPPPANFWAELISDPNPLTNPAHFELGPVAAATLAASPVPPDDQASMAAVPPVASLPETVPLPPVIARLEAEPVPADSGPVIAPLPPVMVRSQAVPLPPRRPDAIAEIESRPPAVTVPRPPVLAAPAVPPAASPAAVPPPTVEASRGNARLSPRESRQRMTSAPAPAAVASSAQQDDRYPLQRVLSALTPSKSLFSFARTESGSLPAAGGRAALYDIAAHTVYLPNGERLEAHSGLGGNFDNPRSVAEKNRGVTPPNVYQLSLRPQLFHGVAALRLTPVDEGKMHGRVGMLAHTYMLGPRGDSNGCVSFRDYQRFLRAFQSGEIAQLVVVPHMGDAPFSVASSGR